MVFITPYDDIAIALGLREGESGAFLIHIPFFFCYLYQTFDEAFCDRQESCEGTTRRYWRPPPILHILGYNGTSPDSHHITGMLWAGTYWLQPQPSIWTGNTLHWRWLEQGSSVSGIEQASAWDALTVTSYHHHQLRFSVHVAS